MTQPSVTKMLGEPLDAKEFPFPGIWSSSLQRDLVLSFCWTIEGLAFRPMKEDRENDWIIERKETCAIDVPAVLVKKKQNLSKPHLNANIERETSVAVALSIDPSQTLPLSMGIKCQVRICMSSQHFNMYMLFSNTPPRHRDRETHTELRYTHMRMLTHTHTHMT